jgi:hypothetical protein
MRGLQKYLPVALVIAVVAVVAVLVWPDLAASRVDLNDNVFHYTLIGGMVHTIERGGNPLDFWSPEWSFGYPVFRSYQPLAHLLVVAIYFALGKTVSLMTVFVWVRFLSVVLLPISFFAAARLFQLSSWESVAAAAVAPLVSTNFLYGLEFGSYLWAGSGLFTQAVAAHFVLLAIGCGYQAIRRGKNVVFAGVLLGLAFLAHFIYGYIGALTICLFAVLPDIEARIVRLGRMMVVGATALAVAAFELIPMLRDASWISHSRWELAWKWDSFGAAQVLRWLLSGELLDHGRFPVLSLLALCGAGLLLWGAYRTRKIAPPYLAVLSGCALWLLLFFGRPFWGPLLILLGVSADVPMHRLIGGAHIFLVLLAGIGLGNLLHAVYRRGQGNRLFYLALTVGVGGLILLPMLRERLQFLSNNATWGQRNLAAYNGGRVAIDVAMARLKERNGRVYPGLAAGWGSKFKVGDVPVYAFLSEAHVPAVAFLYHSMALTGDVMVRFNESNPAHYRLFNIRSVIAPVDATPPLAPFLTQPEQIGRFRIFGAPGAGYFDVVDAPFATKTTRNNFYDVNDRWLQSDWISNGHHIYLDFAGDAPPQIARLAADAALPPLPVATPAGTVIHEQQNGESYEGDVDVTRASFVLFRMTWHPNWKVETDGREVRTAMLSPGFIGIPVEPGRHHVVCRYEPGWGKAMLALAGFLIVGLVALRGAAVPRSVRLPRGIAVRYLWLLILALPVCLPLLTGRVPGGHDAFEYFPRLAEFHENIAHGILLPRWAPDLSRGTGQPLFEFNPPMIYYVAELWHVTGFDFTKSMNLACIVFVIASAISMFLLGRFYFGEKGGWLAAAAYLYAPYFAVDLYIRSALAEFAAFPFVPLSLFGFGAYARYGQRAYLLLGAVSYAGVLFSHNAAALIFTPLLLAFLALTAWRKKSWALLRDQALGWGLGLALGACIWLPSLVERQYVGLNRLLEGYLRYSNHFVYLHQLFDSPWGYGVSVAGDQDGMSFAMGWSHWLLLTAALVLAFRVRKQAHHQWLWFFTAAGALLCLFSLDFSEPLWDGLPLLQYLQFPWRFLGPTAACLAVCIAAVGPVIEHLPRWRNAAFAAALALLIVPNLIHNQPQRWQDVDLSFWTPHQIAARGLEVTTASEYAPKWVTLWPPFDFRPVRAVSAEVQFQEGRRSPVSWSGQVRTVTQVEVEMPIAWFPGWEVRVDSRPVTIKPVAGTDLIRFQLPPGTHQVEAAWTRTPIRWIGDGISLLGLLVLGGAGFLSLPRKRKSKPDDVLTAKAL